MHTEVDGGGTWLERAVSPPFLFVCGVALLPAFLLQQQLVVKAGQVASFYLLCVVTDRARGLRLLWTASLLLLSTLIFNLVSPLGRVLAEWGPLRVTEGALTAGLFKGLTVIGLMFLSRVSVRRSVALPGSLGLYISSTLSYFNRLLDARPKIRGGGLMSRLDALFESVLGEKDEREKPRRERPRPVGIVAACAIVAVNWGLVFFPV